MRVFKFGGASVKNANGVKNLASIMAKSKGNLVVVVSAMGKMTNAFEILIKYYFNEEEEKWEQFSLIKNFHQKILAELFTSEDSINSEIETLFYRIEESLLRKPSINYDYEYDRMVGYGELLSTKIVSAYMNKANISNKWIDIRFSLKTNDKWREAAVDWPLTTKMMHQFFNFDTSRIFVTQGFLGATSSDLTTTLGREGSDFTAAIIGSVLGAEKVEIWKDVPGVLNADPQYFEKPVLIREMSYSEAVELTFFGAKVIHPKTIKPLQNNGIPLHVRSFLKPGSVGTFIGTEPHKTKHKRLPVYILKPKQVLITLSQPDFSFMNEESLAWIFEIFATHNMKVNMIQQAALKLSISIDQPRHGILDLVEKLSEQFEVRYNDSLELITIRYYSPEVIEEVIGARSVYLEQKSRRIARFLVSGETKRVSTN